MISQLSNKPALSLKALFILSFLTLLIQFSCSTSWASSPAHTSNKKIDTTKFARPGHLSLKGTMIESPAWAGCQASSPSNGNPATGKSNPSAKILGIGYSSGSDVGNATITHRQFKYEIETILITHYSSSAGDFGDIHAAAALWVGKNGTQVFAPTAGVTNSASPITINLGPYGSVAVPCVKSNDNNSDVPTVFPELNNGSAPHPPNATVFYNLSITGYASCEAASGWWSDANASADILPHTLTAFEGQYNVRQAWYFQKSP